jgi:hypothetical protein
MNIDSMFQDLHFAAFIHQSTSQFWFERGWNFRFEIASKETFFAIFPNKYCEKTFFYLYLVRFSLEQNGLTVAKFQKLLHVLMKMVPLI